MPTAILGAFSLDRMINANERVRLRLLKATNALKTEGMDYAVAGGNAVAAWVSRVDEGAVRNTRDVDILLHREDLIAATAALEKVGFIYQHVAGMDVVLDGPGTSVREAVHIVFAGEEVRPHELLPNPDVTESEETDQFRVLTLHALVQIKLTEFRDLIEVGLIDQNWTDNYPLELAARLQILLDTPDG